MEAAGTISGHKEGDCKESDPARALKRDIFNQNWVLMTSIKDYVNAFWQHQFENNDLFIVINDEKCVGLRKLMGSKWQDICYNLCRNQAELERKQLWKTDMWFSSCNCLYVEMIRDVITACKIKPKPKCLDILEGLVTTPDIDKEILDDNWEREWVMAPWKQPAIK
eukprot:3157866-Rhodomonas_salina.1